jgi:hypothetical protein
MTRLPSWLKPKLPNKDKPKKASYEQLKQRTDEVKNEDDNRQAFTDLAEKLIKEDIPVKTMPSYGVNRE